MTRMPGLFGRVVKLTSKACHITVFLYQSWNKKTGYDPYQSPRLNLYNYDGGILTLKYDKSIVDVLISSIGWLSRIEIRDGVVTGIEGVEPWLEFIDRVSGDEVQR